MELRQKTNEELFPLYEGELTFHHRSPRGILEAKRILGHFHNYLGEYPPTPELAKSFLATFSHRKPTTIARYAAIVKVFLKWYGEELDINIRVPKTLPSYVEKSDIEKLLEALRSKRSHKNTIGRDLLLVDLAIHSGVRRSELANLRVGDIDTERQLLIVRQGKGTKDRVIPLSGNMNAKLATFIMGKEKEDSLFGLAPATISGKIKTFARKAGVELHTHSLRDYFATSLSEKGATIREIQSLLGHANLTHTERYTLHTDRHLKKAIELLDTEEKSEATTIPVEVRLKHWDRLIKLAEELEIGLQFPDLGVGNMYKSKTGGYFSSSWSLGENRVFFSTEGDSLLFSCLISHLDSEFTKFSRQLEEFQVKAVKLINGEDASKVRDDKDTRELRDVLHLVIERGAFKGSCQICSDWE